MIARVWTGVVDAYRVLEYVAYIEETGVEGYRRTPGCRLASTLTRELEGGRAEVVAFSIWEDVSDIARFAGSDINAMKLYPEDEAYLLEPPTLCHHDVHSFAHTHTRGTTMSNEDVARAFSGHRFEETFDHLAPDVQWILVGQGRVEGADAVVRACRSSSAEMAQVETTWLRFVAAGASDSVAIDAIGRYDGPDGVSVVSSCDIYEFDDCNVTKITSYAVDVDPTDPAMPAVPAVPAT